MLKTSALEYDLPEELIAQHPLPQRDQSRLMVLHRSTRRIEHARFKDILKYLKPGDVLVCNDTRVIPARLFGKKVPSGGRVEVLLLTKRSSNRWECLTKTNGRIRIGQRIRFEKTPHGVLVGTIVDLLDGGRRIIDFQSGGPETDALIEKVGVIPLPPYIHQPLDDVERYQTVYSRQKGAVASPTAGLHFSEELLEKIHQRGIDLLYVTLHISLDTFRPIKEEFVEEHKLYSEYCSVSSNVAQAINKALSEGRRIISVGTTTTRTLESVARDTPEGVRVEPFRGWTDLYIAPPYQFKVINGLITNFHLPRSTLLLLVGAFAGLDNILSAYQKAIRERYRFYTFGDAMLIL